MTKKLIFVQRTEILGLFVTAAKADWVRSFGAENIFLHLDIFFVVCLKGDILKNGVYKSEELVWKVDGF